MIKKLFCVALSIVMTFVLTQSSFVFATNLGTSEKSNSIEPTKDTLSDALINNNFTEDSVLIVMSNSASLTFQEYSPQTFSNVNCSAVYNLMPNVERLVKNKVLNEKANSVQFSASLDSLDDIDEKTYHQILCVTLSEPGKENVLAAIKALQSHPDIIYAGPNYLYTPCISSEDAYYADQWAPAKISLPSAWNITTGSASVKVGIIDEGVQPNHPDLPNRIDWDISRYITSTSLNNLTPGQHTDDSSYIDGHGTCIAGIIAAPGDNDIGIAGACWNAKVVSLKAQALHTAMIATAIDYARVQNIPILNLSAVIHDNDITLQHAVQQYTGLLVCSSGKQGINIDNEIQYPSSFDNSNIIVVGASTKNDTMLSTSNYGKNKVDLFAPGEGILTTAKCRIGCSVCNGKQPGYHSVSGTSFAAPYVAGVAALIKSKYPSLTAAQIKDRIMNSVSTPMQNGQYVFEDLCVSGGRLNAYSAVHNHTLTATDNQDGYTHNVHCSSVACFYHYSEDHAFTVSGVGFECDDCGYYTELLPYAFDNSEIS